MDWEVIQKSQTIKTMVEDLGIDQDSMGEDTIPLSNEEVTSEVFAKVLDWLEHERGKPDMPNMDDDDEDDLFKTHTPIAIEHLDAWQQKYIDIPVPKMFPLLICANFLEIRGLLDLWLWLYKCKVKLLKRCEKIWTFPTQIGLKKNFKN